MTPSCPTCEPTFGLFSGCLQGLLCLSFVTQRHEDSGIGLRQKSCPAFPLPIAFGLAPDVVPMARTFFFLSLELILGKNSGWVESGACARQKGESGNKTSFPSKYVALEEKECKVCW